MIAVSTDQLVREMERDGIPIPSHFNPVDTPAAFDFFSRRHYRMDEQRQDAAEPTEVSQPSCPDYKVRMSHLERSQAGEAPPDPIRAIVAQIGNRSVLLPNLLVT